MYLVILHHWLFAAERKRKQSYPYFNNHASFYIILIPFSFSDIKKFPFYGSMCQSEWPIIMKCITHCWARTPSHIKMRLQERPRWSR